jgi:phosphatidylserine decarboxylase
MLAASAVGAVLAVAPSVALAWKWQLGVRRVAIGVAVLAAVWAAILWAAPLGFVARALVVACAAAASAVAFLAYRFYRDPERESPAALDVVLSPADGEVVYVREARAGTLPVATKHGRDYRLDELTKTPLTTEDAVVVGIGMSFLDVHVNRAPIAGEIAVRRHFPGRFGSLRDPENAFENERATTVIARDGLQIAVVQIASRLVRQIAGYVKEGEAVALGQRIGVIRLGSQVDVVVPRASIGEVAVAPGDRVRAGETVLARLLP